MTITAKFASTCLACKSRINQGEKIQWEKGVGATHKGCFSPTAAAAEDRKEAKSKAEKAQYDKQVECYTCHARYDNMTELLGHKKTHAAPKSSGRKGTWVSSPCSDCGDASMANLLCRNGKVMCTDCLDSIGY